MQQDINLGDLVNSIIQETRDLDTIYSILQWFKTAKPKPTKENALQQMAYHFEEVTEMCEAIDVAIIPNHLTNLKQELLEVVHIDEYCKKVIDGLDNLALLDALCDQIVTALGVGYMMGFDMEGALSEVNRSNWSKFENGTPVINEQGKIIKGKDYTPPNLKPFITK